MGKGNRKSVYYDRQLNFGRQDEFDFAKTFLIFMLAIVHVNGTCITTEGLNYGLPYFLDSVIGGPIGAPMFMFCMGVGFFYTLHKSNKQMFNRGVRLLIVGLILNILRYVLPSIIFYFITGDYDYFMEDLLYKFFSIDILQFAGLAFILYSFLKYLRIKNHTILFISLLMSLVGTIFSSVDTGILPLNIILSPFIGIEDEAERIYSDFPLFNWFIIPISGYCFATWLSYVKDKKRFYFKLFIPCFIMAVSYFIFGINKHLGMFGFGQNCYYHLNTFDAIISIIGILATLGIWFFVSRHVKSSIIHWIRTVSAYINTAYCIQWVLTYWIAYCLLYFINDKSAYISTGFSFALGIIISCVTILLTLAYDRYRIIQKEKCNVHELANYEEGDYEQNKPGRSIMTINKELNGKELKLALEGRLDTVTSSDLSKELDENIENADCVIFDFAKLDYVSSSGLRVLLSTQKTLNAKNGNMEIINVSDEVLEIFEVTGLNDVFTIK